MTEREGLVLTGPQHRALQVLRDYCGEWRADRTGRPITPRDFAQRMWPDSPGWKTEQNVGTKGRTIGVAMPRKGGQFLYRLLALGYVSLDPDILRLADAFLSRGDKWYLSAKGAEALDVAVRRTANFYQKM